MADITLHVEQIGPLHRVTKGGKETKTKYTLEGTAFGAELKLTITAEEEVPSEWRRLLGEPELSSVGNFIIMQIGSSHTQTTIESHAEA